MYNADFVVTTEVLNKEGNFTLKDIISELEEKLLKVYFDTKEELSSFIKNKITSLCSVGLVSYTGIFYYVN